MRLRITHMYFLYRLARYSQKSVVTDHLMSDSSVYLKLVLLPGNQLKSSIVKPESANKSFPILTLWKLSVAMETSSDPIWSKTYCSLSPTPLMLQIKLNLVVIGFLVEEIFMFFSNTHIYTHGRTPARLPSYKLNLW